MKKVISMKKIIDFFFKAKVINETSFIKQANDLIERHNEQIYNKVCSGLFEYKIKPLNGKNELDQWLSISKEVYKEIENTDFEKVFKCKFIYDQNYLLTSYRIYISPSKYYNALNLIYYVALIYINRFHLIEE